ncbi:hypothetical protein [Candidatus Magnetobacterium casense]|uniref:Uncharacterized protein n=1 Tax=Candidatus Magnetobacterium casense TaxID=1455061 RepID=A0ABS6S0J6_9BACT|nr:hypothetical protein [Candidatus Magnetobacterium casensis]MBV6342372.1 hypothetical protein [Candidatus Magnetobacterium casensis]
MAIPVAYRDTLLKQFVQSFVDFIHRKRLEATLLAKGTLTAEEATILSHTQAALARDRAIFQIWRAGLQDHKKFTDPTTGLPFPAGGYNLQQIKTYILNNRLTALQALADKQDIDINHITDLKEKETLNAPLPGDENYPALVAAWQARLAELDDRKARWQAWKTFIQELRNKTDNDFSAEAEM